MFGALLPRKVGVGLTSVKSGAMYMTMALTTITSSEKRNGEQYPATLRYPCTLPGMNVISKRNECQLSLSCHHHEMFDVSSVREVSNRRTGRRLLLVVRDEVRKEREAHAPDPHAGDHPGDEPAKVGVAHDR